MKLFNLKETSDNTGLSRATIYRFYKKNPQLMSETKLKNKKRLIPEAHLILIAKTNIYGKHLKLNQDYTQLKRLVDVLAIPESLQLKLYQLDWDWFGTIAFKNDYNTSQSFHRMQQAYHHIIELYGKKTGFRLFYTVEPFTNREGTHIHFVMKVEASYLIKAITEELKKYFVNNRIELQEYDKYKAGVWYMSKHGLRGENWDILGNNLSKLSTSEN